MQNKARVRCYHICTRMANLRENHKYQVRMQSNWKSHILLMGMQNGIATLEKFGSFLLTAAAAKSLQSCPTLCDPIDSSPPGSPAPGILQARTLEWAAISFSCMKLKSGSEVAQSCPTLGDPMDCSLPGSSIHGIFQARVLEGGAIAFSESSHKK